MALTPVHLTKDEKLIPNSITPAIEQNMITPQIFKRSVTSVIQAENNTNESLSHSIVNSTRNGSELHYMNKQRLSSGKFLRSVECATRYFTAKEKEDKEEKKVQEKILLETSKISEESKSVDYVEYENVKIELEEVKNELLQKEKLIKEQKEKLFKLEYKVQDLTNRVEDPKIVFFAFLNSYEKIKKMLLEKVSLLENELRDAKIKNSYYLDLYQKEKNQREALQKQYFNLLKLYY